MAGKDSSSKRKSSKRKRDKISSQKKSRRKESKKHSRIHGSVHSYSQDESSNSEDTSKSNHKRKRIIQKNKRPRRDYTTSSSSDNRSLSSDSDSDPTRIKARRSQPNLKKRAQKRSKRPKDDGDDKHSGKKRKRSGRDNVVKPKKKKSSKKTIKKHLSSDSESCSISRSMSSNDTADRKRRRNKLILDDERERSRGRESYKSCKTRRIRSPSRSSFDGGSKLSASDGALSPVNDNNININISRRLKSVIAVVNQRYDEEETKLDPYKEEIVYDQNDYSSPKSPDSNEEETKMELDEPELKSRINDGDCQFDVVDMDNFEKGNKEIETFVPVVALEGDALESILRQKALENLKKFKGRANNLKMNNENDENRSSSDVIIENIRNESAEPNFQELNQNSGPLLKSDISDMGDVKKLLDSENVEKEPEMATRAVDQSSEPVSKIDTCLGEKIMNVAGDFISEPSSTRATMTGEQSLEGGNEAKDGSQFEQKTMSVMRGGEMVQVNYKVYIPKKAPALARRPLKR